MSGRRIRGIVGLLLAGALACEEASPDLAPASGEPRAAIFVVLDTVRADRVSTAGYARRTTPYLEALAARGVVFEQAISYAPWTMPSMVATLSGSWGSRPGVFKFGRLARSLVEPIREAGFSTAAFTEGAFVSRDFGFDRGFALYHEEEGTVQRLLPGETRDPGLRGSIERTFDAAQAWLEEHAEERFFLLIHTYEPHTPYGRRSFTEGLEAGAVGETFGTEKLPLLRSGELHFGADDLRYLGALYDGGILESDRQLGRLMQRLEELGLADSTVIAVSSDHGEALGEHDPAAAGDHGHALTDDLLRVPLVIVDPTRSFPVQRVTTQVRTIDILPTLLELLGIERAGHAIDGHSLVPLMRGDESRGRIAFGGATRVAPARNFVRFGGYKYIETTPGSAPDPDRPAPPPRQLYDLEADPGERVNLVEREPELALRYQVWLHEHLEAQQSQAPAPELDAIPDALRERLRSLGYLE